MQHHIRVRYAETDAMGVAHHASYVAWLEVARIEWLREHGHSYRILEQRGFMLPVTRCELRYRRPCRFDDNLRLTTSVAPLGRAQLRFSSVIHCDDHLIAEGEVDLACVDAQGKPQRLPEDLAQLIAQIT